MQQRIEDARMEDQIELHSLQRRMDDARTEDKLVFQESLQAEVDSMQQRMDDLKKRLTMKGEKNVKIQRSSLVSEIEYIVDFERRLTRKEEVKERRTRSATFACATSNQRFLLLILLSFINEWTTQSQAVVVLQCMCESIKTRGTSRVSP